MGFKNAEILALAVGFFKSVATDLNPYTEDDSEIVIESQDTVAMYTPDYLQYAVYGRGAGKAPPLAPILEWVGRRGILFDGRDYEGTAKAIQFLISKNGTVNYTPNPPNALEESLREHYGSFEDSLSQSVLETVDFEIKNIYQGISINGSSLKFEF